MPAEWMHEDAIERMTDRRASLIAPAVVWGAVASLNGGAIPAGISIHSQSTGDGTTWQAFWISSGHIGFVQATYSKPGWAAPSEHAADSVVAWRRPVGTVASVELTTAAADKKASTSEAGQQWHWTSGATLTFSDGHHVDLQPAGRALTDADDAVSQERLDLLLSIGER